MCLNFFIQRFDQTSTVVYQWDNKHRRLSGWRMSHCWLSFFHLCQTASRSVWGRLLHGWCYKLQGQVLPSILAVFHSVIRFVQKKKKKIPTTFCGGVNTAVCVCCWVCVCPCFPLRPVTTSASGQLKGNRKLLTVRIKVVNGKVSFSV